LEGREDLVTLESNSPDLDDPIEPGTEAGGFEIESNERAIHYRNALKSGTAYSNLAASSASSDLWPLVRVTWPASGLFLNFSIA